MGKLIVDWKATRDGDDRLNRASNTVANLDFHSRQVSALRDVLTSMQGTLMRLPISLSLARLVCRIAVLGRPRMDLDMNEVGEPTQQYCFAQVLP